MVHVERGRLDSCVMMPQIVVALQWSGGENGTGRKATLTIGQIRALEKDITRDHTPPPPANFDFLDAIIANTVPRDERHLRNKLANFSQPRLFNEACKSKKSAAHSLACAAPL